jgi:16S rRNA (cytidine1402-2'-O)-methyltransferase
VGGAPKPAGLSDPADLVAAVAARVAAGTPTTRAVKEIAKENGVPRGTVYDAVVAARKE